MAPVLGELSENEKTLFDYLNNSKWEEAKSLVGQPGVRNDCLDKSGMTPLMHAAYKANCNLCKILLSNGADVNSNYQEHGYTVLMFAALSGKPDVVELILQNGGNQDAVNSVGRNAAQMAGFTGQHQVVSLINNFFSRSDLDYYTVPHDLEKVPKLPPKLAPALYKVIINSNLNPVKISLLLRDNPELLEHSVEVVRQLELLCEKMIKARATNEIMSVKFHYLACVVREAGKSWRENDGKLDTWFKLLLRERKPDMFAEKQEELVRSTMKSFPWIECALLQQMIRNIAPVKMGDSPTALSILNSGINGNRMANEEDQPCTTCADLNAKKCANCKSVNYCNKDCQKLHWFTHKQFCKQMAEQFKAFQARYKIMEEDRKKRDEEDTKLEEAAKAEKEANEETTEKPDGENAVDSEQTATEGGEDKDGKEEGAKVTEIEDPTPGGTDGSGDVSTKAGEE